MLEYIGRLVEYLVRNEEFKPLDSESGWIDSDWDNNDDTEAIRRFGPGSTKLGRQHWGVWQLVRIVEGDQYSEEKLSIGTRQDVKNFEDIQHHTRSTGVTGVTILVFRQGLSEEKIQRLLGLQHKALWQNVHNLIWVVDLQTGLVSHQAGLPGTAFLTEELLGSLMSDTEQIVPEERLETLAPNLDTGKAPVVTYTLIGINIALWVLMSIAGGSENSQVLQAFGAKVNSLIVAGEYWRLITPMFLHIGIEHLAFNCFALYQLGTGAEYLFGKWKYLLIYLVAGMFGNLGSFVFSTYLSAGASGAIFGIMGSYLYFGTRERKMFSKGLGGSIITILVINIVYGLLSNRVDNFAHFGGLVGGMLISFVLGLKWEKAFSGSRLAWLLGTIVLFVGFFYAGMTGNI